MNISSRATLSSDLERMYQNFDKNFNLTWDFYIENRKINKKYKHFIDGLTLSNMFSALEILLNDSTIRYLISYPQCIGNKSIDLDIISETYNISSLVRMLAEKKIHDLSYKKIDEYLDKIYNLWNAKNKFKDDLDVIIDGKAIRNLYIHNDRKVDSSYFKQTQNYSKLKIGDPIDLNSSDLEKMKNVIEKLSKHFKEQCIDKFNNNTKIEIFKNMYEASSLHAIVEFTKIWVYSEEKDSLWRVDDFSWHWSGSEEMLFKFFEYIFHGIGSEYIPQALERWKGTPNERIILSWLEYPFHI